MTVVRVHERGSLLLEPFSFVLTDQFSMLTARVIVGDVTEMVIMKLDVLLEMLAACDATIENLVRLVRTFL